MNDWYFINNDKQTIHQGELFVGLPILINHYTTQGGKDKAEYIDVDCIVMTQACDLANGKVKDIIVAGIRDISEIPKRDTVLEINKGRQARYHLINKWEDKDLNYKIIDFSEIYSVPLEYLKKYKEENELNNICLATPYVEYTSQRFGAYFSRIGLPKGIDNNELKEYYKDKL